MKLVNINRVLFSVLPVCVVLFTTGSKPMPTATGGPSSQAEPSSPRPNVTMVFAGDIMAHDVNLNRRPYGRIYERIRNNISRVDLRFANIEFVVDPMVRASGYPEFNASPPYLTAILDAGFNVLSLANNHSYDKGPASMLQTLRTVTLSGLERQIFYNGIQYHPEDKLTPTIIQRNGCRIGFLAVTSFLNKLYIDDRVNVVPFYRKQAEEDLIERVGSISKEFDIFVLSYHCGIEYAKTVPEWKRRLFHRLIDAGVDILWSHHPHVVQPWETIRKGGVNKLVLYSTGNLISGQTWNTNPVYPHRERLGTGEGALFFVTVNKVGRTWRLGRVYVEPILNIQDPEYGMRVIPFDELPSMEFSEAWELYYRHRQEDLRDVLVDMGTWGFEQ